MQLNNPTPFDVTTLPMMGPKERPILVVIAKGTFAFSKGKTDLSPEQVPIAYGDQYYNEQEGGGIRYETDLVPYKPCTDVVLCGSAYAPDQTPTQALDVSLNVGPVQKELKVFGRRLWNHAGVLSRRFTATPARPFVICPIRYSDAFGGIDRTTGEFCDRNIDGKGFYSIKTKTKLAGCPLPRIEDPHHLITSPKDHPRPVGFGFYHRAWQPRAAYAGTYDNTWRVERSPQPPKDFDYRFYNSAHPDLQAKGYLQGNEPVTLTHLTHEGRIQFNLPGVRPLCRVQRAEPPDVEKVTMNLDTVFIEPDERTLCLVWRGNAQLCGLSDETIKQLFITIGNQSNSPPDSLIED